MTADTLILLAIAVGIALVLRELGKTNHRLAEVQKAFSEQSDVAASVHDVGHPVFSLQQLHHVRLGFESAFREQDRLEHELHRTEEWMRMKMPAGPSAEMQERMKAVCEAVAKAESAWREYVWMVEANVAVANGQESRADALRRFGELTKTASGASHRAGDLMARWLARLRGEGEEDLEIHLPGNKVAAHDLGRGKEKTP